MNRRRRVCPRARAWARLVRAAAARSRLCAIAAQVNQAPLAANRPDGRCARGPSIRSAKTCSMTAWARWARVGVHGGQRGVGEEGVVAVGGQQFVLAGRGLAPHPTHAKPGGVLVPGPREGGVGGLGDLGLGDPRARVVVEHRVRVADRDPGGPVDALDRAAHRGVHRHRDREPGVRTAGGADHGAGIERRVAAQQQHPARGAAGTDLAGGAQRLGHQRGCPAGRPRVPAAQPRPAITGAAVSVEIVAISGESPRSSTGYPPTLVCPNPAPCLALLPSPRAEEAACRSFLRSTPPAVTRVSEANRLTASRPSTP
jgi:hypothetical protein